MPEEIPQEKAFPNGPAAVWGLYAVAKRIAMGFYPEAASIAAALSTDALCTIQEILVMTSDTVGTELADRQDAKPAKKAK